MFITSVEAVIGTGRDVSGAGWSSRRLVLSEDGMPYSVHETIVRSGTELRLHYERHSETVYCIEGDATLEDVAEGTVTPISPGVLYSVAVGDEHVLRVRSCARFVCIFDPPLVGQEEAD